MSLPDSLIIPYLEVYTDLPNGKIADLQKSLEQGTNPSYVKKKLGSALVSRYHGEEAAKLEFEWFEATFSSKKKAKPDDIPSLTATFQTNALKLVQDAALGHSNTQIRKLCQQGGVKINDKKVTDSNEPLDLSDGDVLRVGKKHFFEIKVKK